MDLSSKFFGRTRGLGFLEGRIGALCLGEVSDSGLFCEVVGALLLCRGDVLITSGMIKLESGFVNMYEWFKEFRVTDESVDVMLLSRRKPGEGTNDGSDISDVCRTV